MQLSDAKGKLHTITLTPGEEFYTHRGSFKHDELIGSLEGTCISTHCGIEYVAMRPLLADNVLSMPRGAAVVYPKDAGQIVSMADIFPGARVVEAGVGSGALSMSLLRAVGDAGLVHSFEMREEFADIARGNIEQFFGGPHPAWRITVAPLSDGLAQARYTGAIDRVVLDMLAPWENIDAVADALVPGGVVIAYVATVTQMSRFAEMIRADDRFTEPSCSESLVRGWHVDGLAVRPDHRMVGHTGFLVIARRMADGHVAPERRKRGGKVTRPADAPDEAVVDFAYGMGGEERDLDSEDDYGQKPVSDKKIRRMARKSNSSKSDTN